MSCVIAITTVYDTTPDETLITVLNRIKMFKKLWKIEKTTNKPMLTHTLETYEIWKIIAGVDSDISPLYHGTI